MKIEKTERERIIRLVKQQVVPAMGCTEPICVSLCVARAAEVLGERPVAVSVFLSANILKNAIKFTSAGFIEIGYEYSAEAQDVRLYVQDTGIGISPEDQEAIFERFKKLDDFVQGTGLGLSICQAIVKQLNGRILLKSEKNKGCRISLVFEL